jgi:hypothetical protein
MTTQLSLKDPPDLRQSLEADARMLGISVSAAARLRLRTGRVPSVHDVENSPAKNFKAREVTR